MVRSAGTRLVTRCSRVMRKLEHKWIPDQVSNLRWRIGCLLLCDLNDRSHILGEYRLFIQWRANLALQLPYRAVSVETLIFVERAFPRIVQLKEFNPVGPGKLRDPVGWQGNWALGTEFRHQ